MIELFDNWIIDVDEKNYILTRIVGKVKQKTKSGDYIEVDNKKVYGYFSSLSEALKALAKALAMQGHMTDRMTLEEAVGAIQRSNDKVAELLETVNRRAEDGRPD